MLSALRKTVLLLFIVITAQGMSTNSMAGDKENKHGHEPGGIYDENSRLHIKNFHKYGYQKHGNHYRHHDKSYRGRSPSYGRYGYENRHRPKYRQMNPGYYRNRSPY